MVFSTPVFHDGAVIAFTVTFGHYQDIGGARAGSISPHSTEIYHEGILVPPVRIMREGRLNEEAYRIFLRNSRMPDMVEGDTRAMMASCRLADTRVTELLARYGTATVLTAFELCLEQTAARARERRPPRNGNEPRPSMPGGTSRRTSRVCGPRAPGARQRPSRGHSPPQSTHP